MKPVTVRVTEEHIAQGRPWSISANPVALAMSEATGCTCYVGGLGLSVPGRFYCPTPRWLADALNGFDRFGPMEPFEFILIGERGARRADLILAETATSAAEKEAGRAG